ncbi:MAG: hypothetical protein SH818_16155 [Saprospiraceae bacterium]|nr:hypothetical protein [Saprospiraceae bacterium]
MNDTNNNLEAVLEPEADHWLMLWVAEKENDFEAVEVDDFILID